MKFATYLESLTTRDGIVRRENGRYAKRWTAWFFRSSLLGLFCMWVRSMKAILMFPAESRGLRRTLYKYAGFALAVAGLVGAALAFTATTAIANQGSVIAQGRPPITTLPGEILKRLPRPKPNSPPETPPNAQEPPLGDPSGARAEETTPTDDLERDIALAERFRDDWLAQFPASRTSGNRWGDFAYSLAEILNQLNINPIKKETPSVTGTTVRSAIQIALMTAFGGFDGTFGKHLGPREVYDEKAADQLSRLRLDSIEHAIKEYVGEREASAFRDARDPRVKVQIASDAILRMIAEQKAKYPNAVLLNLANPVMHDIGLEMIERVTGDGALYVAFMNERNPRIKSAIVADVYAQMFKRLSLLAGTDRGDLSTWIADSGVDVERRRKDAERVVLENLGLNGKNEYRALRNGREKENYWMWAYGLEALGTTSWIFATLTPDNLGRRGPARP